MSPREEECVMRTREEILRDAANKEGPETRNVCRLLFLVVEVLLDIREVLRTPGNLR